MDPVYSQGSFIRGRHEIKSEGELGDVTEAARVWSNARKGPQAKECRWPLEAGKSLRKESALLTIDFSPLSDFDLLTSKTVRKFVVLSY